MLTDTDNDTAVVQIQEREVKAIEDRSLSAEQILNRPAEPDERPGLFIP